MRAWRAMTTLQPYPRKSLMKSSLATRELNTLACGRVKLDDAAPIPHGDPELVVGVDCAAIRAAAVEARVQERDHLPMCSDHMRMGGY